MHAPYGLLNEKLRGCNSSKERPQLPQARCWQNVSVGAVDDLDDRDPVGELQGSLQRIGEPAIDSFFATSRSTTTSTVCW